MGINKNNYCVIMAGGTGSRLWPQSRVSHPKQFIDLFGMGRTLLQVTYERFTRIIPKENIIVSTHSDYSDLVREQLPELPAEQILHEPARKGTAPSMAFAAYHIRTLNPHANIVMAPADQMIFDEARFVDDMHHALDYAATHDCLLTVGIRPTHPETRYGYIQVEGEGGDGFGKVRTFTEKPELEFARIFVESGEFFWNTVLKREVKYCKVCHNISDTETCLICANPGRDASTICVVENVRDVMAVEATQQFRGLYHVLGGVISPMDGIGPSDLQIESLVERVKSGTVKEVILALSSTMEGDTTNFFIFRKLAPYDVKMSVIARGISIGDELQYTDEVTLGRSIVNRTLFTGNM